LNLGKVNDENSRIRIHPKKCHGSATQCRRQVLVALENLMSSLPKIHRSLSEPILNRTNLHADDLFADSCSSPKTPVNAANLSSFTFVSNVI
jgi:hypothetical protein